MALALGQDDAFRELLPSLLRVLTDVPNRELDEKLCAALGASHGVYVLVWMSLPRPDELRKHHRPK